MDVCNSKDFYSTEATRAIRLPPFLKVKRRRSPFRRFRNYAFRVPRVPINRRLSATLTRGSVPCTRPRTLFPLRDRKPDATFPIVHRDAEEAASLFPNIKSDLFYNVATWIGFNADSLPPEIAERMEYSRN